MADGFLGRWSRRKQEVREGKPLEEPAPPAPTLPAPVASSAPLAVTAASGASGASAAAETSAPTADAPPPPPTLADAQVLTPASDFKAFVARDVSPEVRNLAMKKLFADPHFNVMDGLDIYIGDYTQPAPLPEGMLRKMVSAHTLGFFDHEKSDEGADPGAPGAPSTPDIPGATALTVPAPDSAAAATTATTPITASVATEPREDAHTAPPADVAQSLSHTAVSGNLPSEPALATPAPLRQVATPASHTPHDHDADLRLQPDHAPRREGAGHGSA